LLGDFVGSVRFFRSAGSLCGFCCAAGLSFGSAGFFSSYSLFGSPLLIGPVGLLIQAGFLGGSNGQLGGP
jgi:hypothetical protein